MDTIQQLTEAARRLTAEELRARLAEIDQEARLIRSLLRAVLYGDSRRQSDKVATSEPMQESCPVTKLGFDPDVTRRDDAPYWAAALVAAIRAGDTRRQSLARRHLRRLGYRIDVVRDEPAL